MYGRATKRMAIGTIATVLHTVRLKDTFTNINFTAWATWTVLASRAVMKTSLILIVCSFFFIFSWAKTNAGSLLLTLYF